MTSSAAGHRLGKERSMPDLLTDHSRASLEGAHSHGPARYVSSRADRPTSFDPADIPVPGGREEEWRPSHQGRLEGRPAQRGAAGPRSDTRLTLASVVLSLAITS